MKQNFSSTQKIGPRQSNLNQVIDVIQEDISGSATRRKYETFVTGGVGPGVTSSIYQTIYDQDFTLQTANPILDFTVGLYHHPDRPNLVKNTTQTGYEALQSGQLIFDPASTMMMREKVNVYRQYAKMLLRDADKPFSYANPGTMTNPSDFDMTTVGTATHVIDAALFVNVKRLFHRDGIRKETFAMRIYRHAPLSHDGQSGVTMNSFQPPFNISTAAVETATSEAIDANQRSNIFDRNGTVDSSVEGVQIIADLNAEAEGTTETYVGHVSPLKLASDTTKIVGLLYHDAGIAVLNLGGSTLVNNTWIGTAGYNNSVPNHNVGWGQTNGLYPLLSPHDRINGLIDGMSDTLGTATATYGETQVGGQIFIGNGNGSSQNSVSEDAANFNSTASFYPDLLVSASIDDIVDHVGYTRFSSGSLTAVAFQNETQIYSTMFFCTAEASEFNQSSNDTFVALGENPNKTFITTVLLYGSGDLPVAVAKLNRPIEKTPDSSLTVRVRLDF